MSKYDLSPRQMEVLKWASFGKTGSEIAEIMGVSRHSVQMVLLRIYDKLGAANAAGAVGFCFRNGILK